jgi:hypothetical protein
MREQRRGRQKDAEGDKVKQVEAHRRHLHEPTPRYCPSRHAPGIEQCTECHGTKVRQQSTGQGSP